MRKEGKGRVGGGVSKMEEWDLSEPEVKIKSKEVKDVVGVHKRV